MCEAQRAWKRGKLGCVWSTNLYEKTAVQLLGKKEREAPRKKKGRTALGEKDWRRAPRAREAGLTVELLRQSQKNATIKTTAQRASRVKILRAKSRKKTVAQRSGKNRGRSTASCVKIINLVGAQKIKLCSHSRNMYLTPWDCSGPS